MPRCGLVDRQKLHPRLTSLADRPLVIPSDGGDTYPVSLADGWNDQADNWIAWAREPGHDAYWRHHRRQLLGLLPPPGKLTLDIGCGEGRVSRDLALGGHNVVAFDLTEPMIQAAAEHPDMTAPCVRADAAAVPVADGTADLVVSFMALQDTCFLYTSPSPRDATLSRMPSSA